MSGESTVLGNGRAWPAASVENWEIGRVKLNPKNPRRHTLEQIENIAQSMRKRGFVWPVLVDEDGMLIAGHGRIRAARLIGFETAPVIIARGWTPEECEAFMVADNALADQSDWDPKLIRATLKGLKAKDFDLGLVGMTQEDLAKLMIDPSEVGEAREVVMEECPVCGSRKRKIET